MTPTTLHYGLADHLTAKRQTVLAAVYAQHPQRFVKELPTHPKRPDAVWINLPQEKVEAP